MSKPLLTNAPSNTLGDTMAKKLLFGGSLKDFDIWDLGLTKWAVFTFALFIVSVWPEFTNWVTSTHWGWFLAVAILFAIKPVIKYWS